MLTSVRGLSAAAIILSSSLLAAPAFAQEETDPPSDLEISGTVTFVTDYRFRGISLSGGDPAIQGSIDVTHSSGFYVGAWGSSLDGGDTYGEMELDLYGGWSGDIAEGLSADVGLVYYAYPSNTSGAGPAEYWEALGSLSTTFGPAEATFGVGYSWDQASLGDQDNLYLYTDLGVGIPNTPISLSGHAGYTDGFLTLTDNGKAWDYSIGATASLFGGLELGVSYIGVEGPSIDGISDDTVLATLSFSF